jgi:uncharacterized glyoxalase superfamily protein PhnB
MNTPTIKLLLAVLALAPLACSNAPKADTAKPDQTVAAPAPAPTPAPPPAKPIPDGFHTLTPQLTVKGLDAAIEFYGKALGAQKLFVMAGPDGKPLHAEIKIGDSIVMLDEENLAHGMKSPLALGGTPGQLMVYVPDADAAVATLTAAGAKVTLPLEAMFWGDRYGELVDPFGHTWAVATHIEDLTPEQTAERGKLAMQPPPKGKKPKKGAPPAWKKIAGAPATEKQPKEYRSVTPAFTVADAAAAIEFYKAAFGATEKYRMLGPDGKKVMHAELQLGDSALMLTDTFAEMGGKNAGDLGGSPVALHYYVTDVDGVFAKATGAGAKPAMPVADQFWGDRYGLVVDPSGIPWGVATHKEDVPPEQMAERMKKQMQQAKPAA